MDSRISRFKEWRYVLKIAGYFGLAAFISTIIFWYFFIGISNLEELYESLEWTLYSVSSALLSSLLLSVLFTCFRQKNLGAILLVSGSIVFLSYPLLPVVIGAVGFITSGSLSGMENVVGTLLFMFLFTGWITFPAGLLAGYLIYKFD